MKCDPPFVSLIVSVCICFIQNRLSNNIWVVQFLRFKLVDYFHKQFVYEKAQVLSYSQYHTIWPKTCLKKNKKKERKKQKKKWVCGTRWRELYICHLSALEFTLTLCVMCRLWSPCTQTLNRSFVWVITIFWIFPPPPRKSGLQRQKLEVRSPVWK